MNKISDAQKQIQKMRREQNRCRLCKVVFSNGKLKAAHVRLVHRPEKADRKAAVKAIQQLRCMEMD